MQMHTHKPDDVSSPQSGVMQEQHLQCNTLVFSVYSVLSAWFNVFQFCVSRALGQDIKSKDPEC